MQTPLGYLEIKIDDDTIEYKYLTISTDRVCPDLNGRYAIVIPFQPDKATHTISCRLKNYTASIKDGPESGENLELYSFYRDCVKLSIGMEGDTDYINGERISNYDYDTEYLSDGVQYCILPMTKTEKYVFGIAWLNNVTENTDIQTWFGADPTLQPFTKSL